MFRRLDTIHECDRQTDRQTDVGRSIAIALYAQRRAVVTNWW